MAPGVGASSDRFGALCAALYFLSSAAPLAAGFGEAPRFLLASSPSTATIGYLRLPEDDAPRGDGPPMRVLVGSGHTYPQGIAVDDYRQMLYVADPSLGKLVRYPLLASGKNLKVGKMETVASDVEVRAVAVDGLGNVWFTDEPQQRILRLTAQMIEKKTTTPEVVYDGASMESVRSPGGIAVDNFYVYWLNKASGQSVGSLIRAPQSAPGLSLANLSAGGQPERGHTFLQSLSKASDKSYGVCLTSTNAFFTDEFNKVYGVSRTAVARDEATAITASFGEPRGCAFDGDGTVYVADKAHNAIYQFASNMERLRPDRLMTKAAEMQGAFGLAIYTHLTD